MKRPDARLTWLLAQDAEFLVFLADVEPDQRLPALSYFRALYERHRTHPDACRRCENWEGACSLRHKPRLFPPLAPVDPGAGWRRNCADFAGIKERPIEIRDPELAFARLMGDLSYRSR